MWIRATQDTLRPNRRVVRDYKGLTDTLQDWHCLAFLGLLLSNIRFQSP